MATINNIVFADNAYGTLGAGLAIGDTTLNFTSGHGARFPAVTAGQSLYCCILNSSNVLEEIIVTAHTAGADTATITRAAGSTTARAWDAGDRIEARFSASAMVAAFNTAYAITTSSQTFTKAQRGAPGTLSSTSNAIAVDLSLANNFVLTMTENSTFSSASNVVAGQSGAVVITQGTGTYTLAFNGFWKWAGTATGTISTAANAVDLLTYYTVTSTSAMCALTKNYV